MHALVKLVRLPVQTFIFQCTVDKLVKLVLAKVLNEVLVIYNKAHALVKIRIQTLLFQYTVDKIMKLVFIKLLRIPFPTCWNML